MRNQVILSSIWVLILSRLVTSLISGPYNLPQGNTGVVWDWTWLILQLLTRGFGCIIFSWLLYQDLLYLWNSKRMPNGTSGGVPVVGDLLTAIPKPKEYFERMKKFTLFTGNCLYTPIMYCSTDEDVQWVMSQERKGNVVPLDIPHIRLLLGNSSMIFAHGEYHKRIRRVLEPGLAPAAVDSYLPVMDRFLQDVLYTWADRQIVVTPNDVKNLALQTFGRCVLPDVDDTLIREIVDCCTTWMWGMASPIPYRIPGWQLDQGYKARARLVEIFWHQIESFRARFPPESAEAQSTMLGRFCYAKSGDNKHPFSKEETLDNVLLIFLAGHETTSGTIGSLLYRLHKHPEVIDALRKEIQETMSEDCPTNEQLKTAPILNACLAELWRIDPPTSCHNLMAVQDMHYKGYTIPKGAGVSYVMMNSAFDEEKYVDPESYRISRFLPSDHPLGDIKYQTPNFQSWTTPSIRYRPFAAGVHTCIGHHFAKLQLRLFLVRLIQNYDFEVKSSELTKASSLRYWLTNFTIHSRG